MLYECIASIVFTVIVVGYAVMAYRWSKASENESKAKDRLLSAQAEAIQRLSSQLRMLGDAAAPIITAVQKASPPPEPLTASQINKAIVMAKSAKCIAIIYEEPPECTHG